MMNLGELIHELTNIAASKPAGGDIAVQFLGPDGEVLDVGGVEFEEDGLVMDESEDGQDVVWLKTEGEE